MSITEINPVTDGGNEAISFSQPYRAAVRLLGDSDILFHRWNVEAVAAKASAAKGSKAKKSDDVESYLYRDEQGDICLPGEYLRQAMIAAAKFEPDPRSARKSACDLVKAAIVPLTQLASLGMKDFHYEHQARVQIQRNGITRTRPAIKKGWECDVLLMVVLPEYISPEFLRRIATNAGRFIGVGDFRPTYGRFSANVSLID